MKLSLHLNYSTCSIERASTGLNIKGQLEPICASVPEPVLIPTVTSQVAGLFPSTLLLSVPTLLLVF